MPLRPALLATALLASSGFLAAQSAPAAKPAPPAQQTPATPPDLTKPVPYLIPPTEADVAYGKHPKQQLDLWRAKGDGPAPVLVFIHGGGWRNGHRSRVGSLVKQCLDRGISVATVSYRFVNEAGDTKPPVKAPMMDAARAVQFIRHKAPEWGIDKTKVVLCGSSAGACTSLWIAFHDDLADPKSKDPVARESTRVLGAAVVGPQTSLDPKQMREWTPNIGYGAHAFGVKGNFDAFLAERERLLPMIREYSPYELVSKDDPPVALFFSTAPAMGKPEKDATHSANFGVGLKKRCDELGVTCTLTYPGHKSPKFAKEIDFIAATLGK
jgi:acetyl esterase/lipase